MTEYDIVEKVIKIAFKNGAKPDPISIDFDYWIKHKFYYAVIFSTEFAKAFFGIQQVYDGIKTNLCNECDKKYTKELAENNNPAWQFHLQQMVIEDKPYNYLEKYLTAKGELKMIKYTKDTIWTNFHGISKPLKDLDDSHLANILNFLADNIYTAQLREVIKSIAKDRGLKDEYLERSQIPYKNPRGNWEIWDKERGLIEVSKRKD